MKKLQDVNFDVEMYGRLNKKEQEEVLWENIERFARNETEVDIAGILLKS